MTEYPDSIYDIDKVCNRCGERKMKFDFLRSTDTEDGRNAICADCLKLKSTGWKE